MNPLRLLSLRTDSHLHVRRSLACGTKEDALHFDPDRLLSPRHYSDNILSSEPQKPRTSTMRRFRGPITRPGSRMRDVYASCRPYPAPAGTRKTRLRLVASLLLPLRCLWHLTPCIRTALKSRSPFTCGLGLDTLLFALSAFTESVSTKSFNFDLPHLIIPFLWIYLGAIQTRPLCHTVDHRQKAEERPSKALSGTAFA